jgi:PAS domain S-box-containing protein
VDGDAALRCVRNEVLREAGFEVIDATTGPDALKLACETQPALIILALESPGIDGVAVCKHLKLDVCTESIPVLHIARSGELYRGYRESLESGADTYLQEPVEPPVLIAVATGLIRASCDGARTVRAEGDAAASSRLAALIDSIPDEVWFADSQHRFTLANAAALSEFHAGTSPLVDVEELARSLEVFRADGSPRPVEEAPPLRALRGETVRDMEEIVRTPGRGELRHRQVSAAPVLDAAGKVVGAVSVVRDITERKRAEEEMRRSEERYRMLFDSLIEGFCIIEVIFDAGVPVDYRFLEINPAFERQTGLRNAKGQLMRELAPEHEAHWFELYGQVALTGQPARFINQAKALNRWYDVRAYRVGGPESPRVAILFNDITDLKEAEQETVKLQAQFHQAQKMESIGCLAGGVAHDFNNLLTVINGYSAMLLAKMSSDNPIRERLQEIHKAGERAAALTRQLLAYSRQQVLDPRKVDLNRILEEMRPMLERLVGEDIEVRVALNAKIGTVNADPSQLEQVVMNLVVNARDAMPAGGALLVQTANVERNENLAGKRSEACARQYVILSVSDTGVGMDKELQNRIFEPFFTTKELGKGTGLGLSTVQGIVVQSGGYVEVHSEKGKGTTFEIYLPALAEAPADDVRAEAPPVLGGEETVLVVEDQAGVRSYAVEVLQEYGYQVITAESADDALMQCELERIDLVLTDVVMPKISGRDVAERLMTLHPGIKVLFMSGYTDNIIEHNGVLEEGTNFIQKPFSPEELARKIRVVLGAPLASPARILVADDEAGVRRFCREVLEDGGHEVIEAADGKQALKQVRAGHVDLVITDLVMPEQEGIETIQTLRREAPGVAIIAISGAFGGEFLKTARLLGADAVLNKPVNGELLLAKVSEVLKMRR